MTSVVKAQWGPDRQWVIDWNMKFGGGKMARFATDIIEPIKQKIKKTVSGPSADIALNEIADNETCQLKVILIHIYYSQHRKVKRELILWLKVFWWSPWSFVATSLLPTSSGFWGLHLMRLEPAAHQWPKSPEVAQKDFGTVGISWPGTQGCRAWAFEVSSYLGYPPHG